MLSVWRQIVKPCSAFVWFSQKNKTKKQKLCACLSLCTWTLLISCHRFSRQRYGRCFHLDVRMKLCTAHLIKREPQACRVFVGGTWFVGQGWWWNQGCSGVAGITFQHLTHRLRFSGIKCRHTCSCLIPTGVVYLISVGYDECSRLASIKLLSAWIIALYEVENNTSSLVGLVKALCKANQARLCSGSSNKNQNVCSALFQ